MSNYYSGFTGLEIDTILALIRDSQLTLAELVTLHGVVKGTASANKAIVLDSNKDVVGVRNISGDVLYLNERTSQPGNRQDEWAIYCKDDSVYVAHEGIEYDIIGSLNQVLTFGNGLDGGSYNGETAKTISIGDLIGSPTGIVYTP